MWALKLSTVLVCAALALGQDALPAWSNTYSVKGAIFIPYAELVEPFSAWYDGPNDQSRIDYYGDMVQTYQISKYEKYGTNLKIVPLTDEEVTNSKTCYQVNGTQEETVSAQTILPDTTGFVKVGEETILGKDTEIWRLNNTVGQKFNRYTLWVYYITDPDTGDKTVVPVRYELRGYNTLLGSHYDHYYVVYNDYNTDPISKETFEINNNLTCTHFPGPGVQHTYTFNPIAEFIHPVKTAHVDHEFKKFVKKHNKQYTDGNEHLLRLETFRQNLRLINSHNRANKGYTLAVNHLADKSPNELRALRGRISNNGAFNGGQPFPYTKKDADDVPEQWDWRIYGAVTTVKDQSICGSCWAFGTVGTIEGAYFLKNKELVTLSQQALVDCSWGFGNNGCDGGEDFRSYEWILKHGGLPTEEAYGPYLGQDGYCHAEDVKKVAQITGWVNVTTNDEDALRLAIFKNGPVSVAIDASHPTFAFYSNGVYNEPTCGNKETDLDHAVLAVGYGSINGDNYWLVKNSWSNLWGNDGYVLMSSKDNNCGVMTQPTYVTL